MKVVNLSRRPFTNRRPVMRIATFFWVLGGLLLLLNLWLYGSHFSGSSKGQGRLEALQRQIDQEQDRLGELSAELQGLELGSRNRQARYLNSLIHTRTFPWSALFDDLEDVLPIDVYLGAVQPSLKLAEQPAIASSQPRRALTAREARARARGEVPDRVAEEIEEEEEDYFSGDRVSLTVRGYARNDEALFDFVDRLYQDPSFQNPDLSRESKDKAGKINFNIKVTYLTPKRGAVPEEGSPPAEADLASNNLSNNTPGSPSATGPGASSRASRAGASVDPGRGGQAAADTGTVVDRGSRSAERPPRSSRSSSRGREVRRGASQQHAGLPPEEGESRAAGEAPRRRDRAAGRADSRSRSTNPGFPSTVSVGPSVNPNVNPGGQEGSPNPTQPSGGSTLRPTPTTERPTPDRGEPDRGEPDRGEPDRGEPDRGEPDRGEIDPRDPTPTTPSASSSPRLQGSLIDRFLPDVLRWILDDTEYEQLTREVAG